MTSRPSSLALAWLVAFAVAAAAYLAARAWGPDLDAVNFNSGRLATAGDGAVLFVGTSLTACAVPFDSAMTSIAAASGRRLEFVRLTRGNGVQEDFVPILDDIQASKAGVVLIEAEMMLRERVLVTPDAFAHAWAGRFRAPIRALVANRAGMTSTNPANQGTKGCVDRGPDPARLEARVGAARELRAGPWSPQWRRFIGDSKRRGRRLVLVSLGRSAALQRRIDPAYAAKYQRRLLAATQEFGFELWVFDAQSLPDEDFSDGVHMNARGRAAFTRWLMQRLAVVDARN